MAVFYIVCLYVRLFQHLASVDIVWTIRDSVEFLISFLEPLFELSSFFRAPCFILFAFLCVPGILFHALLSHVVQ